MRMDKDRLMVLVLVWDLVMDIILSFQWAAMLVWMVIHFTARKAKNNSIYSYSNYSSLCCECHAAPTILLRAQLVGITFHTVLALWTGHSKKSHSSFAPCTARCTLFEFVMNFFLTLRLKMLGKYAQKCIFHRNILFYCVKHGWTFLYFFCAG